ncbi:hypothetical protein Dxin01_04020 [Deinococcus xinjiangensis]|uniref:Uncharacterized protein n=1 Tax=Deinococcus xinjiangensis TaxID=457454 RepID=A0ABP9VHN0_9DEIO
MKKSILLLLLCAGYAGAQARPQTQTVTDPNIILRLMRGDVTMIGANFPNATFQKGVLNLVRSRAIAKLSLLTTVEQAANMAPLKAAGAAVYYLPVKNVRMTGNSVFVGNNTVILQVGPQQWTVIQGNQIAAQAKASTNLYFSNAKRY